MTYKISGATSEAIRIIIIKESDWSILDNDTYSAGQYEIDLGESNPGNVLAVGRKSDGESFMYGNVTPVVS